MKVRYMRGPLDGCAEEYHGSATQLRSIRIFPSPGQPENRVVIYRIVMHGGRAVYEYGGEYEVDAPIAGQQKAAPEGGSC